MNWLLLRGLVREQRHWRDFPKLLSEKTKSTVLCLDVPGMGTESARKSPYSIKEIMYDVRERFLLAKKNIDKDSNSDWGICCVSLGSMIALQWAHEYPNDFKHIVITNTSCKPLSSTFERFMPKNVLQIPRLLFANNKKAREKVILKMTSNKSDSELDRIAEDYAKFSLELSQFQSVGIAHLIAGSRFSIPQTLENSHGKSNRFLVINSQKDTLVSPKCSKVVAKYLNAPLVEHPNANHDLSLDDPEWFVNEVIKPF